MEVQTLENSNISRAKNVLILFYISFYLDMLQKGANIDLIWIIFVKKSDIYKNFVCDF